MSKVAFNPQNGPVDTGNKWEEIGGDQLNSEIAREMIRRTDKLMDSNVELAIRVKQAREFIEWSANHVKASWLDWEKVADKAVKDTNMLRMYMESQTRAMIAAGKDCRDFFSSPEYLTAHKSFTELIALLDRFNAFKQDGTLDAFADFILKVSCKSTASNAC